VNVGVPQVLQKKDSDATASKTAADIAASAAKFMNLVDVVRRRGDIPDFLRCHVCGRLPENVLWASCCDVLVCCGCLGPPGIVTPSCPVCDEERTLVVVSAVRHIVAEWFHASVANMDARAARAYACVERERREFQDTDVQDVDVGLLAVAQERLRLEEEAAMPRKSKMVCRYWMSGRCTAGASCKYMHKYDDNAVQLCVFVDGDCPDGNKCKYRHYRLPHEQNKRLKANPSSE
jgi:hypothetical protein